MGFDTFSTEVHRLNFANYTTSEVSNGLLAIIRMMICFPGNAEWYAHRLLSCFVSSPNLPTHQLHVLHRRWHRIHRRWEYLA